MDFEPTRCDVLIIGAGAAGLTLALHLASKAKVTVLAKGPLTESCTLYAQGGIAAVLDKEDSIDSHIADTLTAGGGLCDEEAVRFTVENAPAAITWLVENGVSFTREKGKGGVGRYHLGREGGHSHRRIIHAADATGRAIETTLVEQARSHPNIRLLERHIAIDLVTGMKLGLSENRCLGAYVLDRNTHSVKAFAARAVALCTGGASKVYLYSTNPDLATGDGIAMGWRAGCRVANMEFNQFHPTCLHHPSAKRLLITEALRGEGAVLRLPDGAEFMSRFDERAELAPRDVVARAIDHEMKRLGSECLYLDITHKPAEFIISHFPNVYASCKHFGIDITRDPIPVVPAAHFTCGGLVTDLFGRTDLPALYAVGESAFTGLHGANRMASNSLLECLVFARSAAEDILYRLDALPPLAKLPPWDESRVTDSDEEVVVSHNWDELRRMMWDYVGIVRTNKRLERAKRRADLLRGEIADYYGNFRVTNDLLELRNLVEVADLIIRSAMSRKESRGLHYTLDYPATDARRPPQNTLLTPDQFRPADLAWQAA